MKITNLPPGVQDFLARCPQAGDGVNRWIFRAALTLHRARVPESAMSAIISLATKNCGRMVTAHEIERAVVNSGSALRNGPQAKRRTPKWPTPNAKSIEAIVSGGTRLDALKEISPVRWDDGKSHAGEIIGLLFPGNPLLCIGQSNYVFNTKSRASWRDLADQQFIVPSPMRKVTGITTDGKVSEHSLDNTGPRRFLIVECDNGSFNQHAAILLHLAKFAPLVMAVHSGGKSLHGWFYVGGEPEAKIKKFFRYAVSLGADPQLWVRSQFVRMPDGRRENGKRQEVMYFNPQILEGK